MDKNTLILSELKQSLHQRHGSLVKDVILFGSRAQNRYKPTSDYDVLLILSKANTSKTEGMLLDSCYDIDLKYGIVLDIHILAEEDLQTPRGTQAIYRQAITNGIYA